MNSKGFVGTYLFWTAYFSAPSDGIEIVTVSAASTVYECHAFFCLAVEIVAKKVLLRTVIMECA